MKNEIVARYGQTEIKEEMSILFSDDPCNLKEDAGGEVLQFKSGYLVRKENDEKSQEVLFISDGKAIYATVSPTFINTFVTFQEWSAEYGFSLKALRVLCKKGKNGRDFIDMNLEQVLDKDGRDVL